MLAAEKIAQILRKAGVRHAFGVPSGPWVPYMDAFRGQGIEFVLVSNEASAGFMGDVCARITGIPGVCYGTFGPGATNLATGVGCALLDRSPLIALTTEAPAHMRGRTMQMVIDHQALYGPLSKWTTRASLNDLDGIFLQAVRVACSEKPGPVHIGLPADLGNMTAPSSAGVADPPASGVFAPDEKMLETACTLFLKARKPLLAVGLTAARLNLGERVARFSGKFGLPVLLTPMAKGLIPESHPWYAGVLFHALSDRLAETHREADLVIGIGYDPVEFLYEEWVPDVPLICMDTLPADVDRSCCPRVVDVAGDPAGSLERLLRVPASRSRWDQDALAARRQRLFSGLEPPGEGFGPRAALEELRSVMPGDGVLTCDVGAHTHLLGQMWRAGGPGRFIMTNGWSSMGFGMPAAIAAKLCLPQKAVACVVGDGGFLMMAGELATASRLGVDVVFLLLVDGALSLIQVKRAREGLDSYGTDLVDGGFLSGERLFGASILTARDRGELRGALDQAFCSPGPVVVQALIEGREYRDLIAGRYK